MLKAILVTTMACLTIGFGIVAWFTLHPAESPATAQAPAPPPPPPTASILVTARAIAPGALLKPEDVATASVLLDAVPQGARLDTPADRAALSGAMARRALAPQQPVLPPDILRPSEGGFLAAVLGPGHRAVSVAVDAVSGTAGLIWPGDRVDVILTQTLDDSATPVGRRTLGETVLVDVRVVAVDQQIAHASGGDAAQGGRTVTLSVTPAQAERMAVAVRLGRVALSVRPSATPQTGTSPPPPSTKRQPLGDRMSLQASPHAAPPQRPSRSASSRAPPRKRSSSSNDQNGRQPPSAGTRSPCCACSYGPPPPPPNPPGWHPGNHPGPSSSRPAWAACSP